MLGKTTEQEQFLIDRVIWIRNRDRQRVRERGDRFLEAHAMLTPVVDSLPIIPDEAYCHARTVASALIALNVPETIQRRQPPAFDSIFAHVSLSPTVRLNTNLPGAWSFQSATK